MTYFFFTFIVTMGPSSATYEEMIDAPLFSISSSDIFTGSSFVGYSNALLATLAAVFGGQFEADTVDVTNNAMTKKSNVFINISLVIHESKKYKRN